MSFNRPAFSYHTGSAQIFRQVANVKAVAGVQTNYQVLPGDDLIITPIGSPAVVTMLKSGVPQPGDMIEIVAGDSLAIVDPSGLIAPIGGGLGSGLFLPQVLGQQLQLVFNGTVYIPSASGTPQGTAGLVGAPISWLRADTNLTSAAGKVATWTDIVGGGNPVVAGTPAQVAADASFGNQPSVNFGAAASGDYMQYNEFVVVHAQPTTSYLVGIAAAGASAGFFYDGVGATFDMKIDGAGNFDIEAGATLSKAQAATAAFVAAGVYNGATSAIYFNNSQTAIITGAAGADSFDNWTLGANRTAATTGNVKIAELMLFAGAHNASQRAAVFAYLAQRYGLSAS